MTDSNPAAAAMVQCAITGKLVAEDELVSIGGLRVCAEGKTILLQRLKAGESLTGALETPGVVSRLGAMLIDGLILFLFTGLLTSVFARLVIGPGGTPAFVLSMIQLPWLIIAFSYYGILPLAGGQTLGKMYCRIITKDKDGSPLRLRSALFRGLLFLGPNLLAMISSAMEIARVDYPGVVGVIAMIIGGWYLCDVLFALFDTARQRSLHDRIAGTRVVVKE